MAEVIGIQEITARELRAVMQEVLFDAMLGRKITFVSYRGETAAVIIPAKSKHWRGVSKAIREAAK